MSKISELSDGGVIQGGDTLIAVRSGGNVKVTYGGSTTANIDGGTIDGTVIGGSTAAAGSFTTLTASGDVNFDSNTLFVDASANAVGVNTSSPYTALDVSGGTTNQVGIFRSTDATATVGFADNTTPLTGNLSYVTLGAVGNNMVFNTNLAEAMRIDLSGNLLVGKTAGSSNTVGFETSADGTCAITRSGGQPLLLNRQTSDGDIILFRKDGTTVGSIGVSSGAYLTIGTGDTGILFDNAGNRFYPCNASTQANLDNAIDIGASTVRFKDLYLSGGVYLGGTGAANKLDDYEEGTWTPTLIGTTSGSATVTVTTATYTKVGRQVFVAAYITADLSTHNVVGVCQIGGLPFTATSNEMGGGNSPYCQLFTTDLATTSVHFRPLGSTMRLQKGSSSSSFLAGDLGTSAASIMMLNATYIA